MERRFDDGETVTILVEDNGLWLDPVTLSAYPLVARHRREGRRQHRAWPLLSLPLCVELLGNKLTLAKLASGRVRAQFEVAPRRFRTW